MEAELRAGLPVEKLPKPFRDAAMVCLRLKLQYLWIDSLCIFQDNVQDWATEDADMYSNAVCNIAATGASNLSVRLFSGRNTFAHQPFGIVDEPCRQHCWVFFIYQIGQENEF